MLSSLKTFVVVIAAWQVACPVATGVVGYAIGWLVHSVYTGVFGDVQESYFVYARVSTYAVIFTVTALATGVGVTLLTVLEDRRATFRQVLATFVIWHATTFAAMVASEEFSLFWVFHRLGWMLFGAPENFYSFRNVMLPRVIAWVLSSTAASIVVLWLRSRVAPVQSVTAPLLEANRRDVADENPYEAPQAEASRAGKSVPTWRIVVGGSVLFSILGPFFIVPLIVAVVAGLLEILWLFSRNCG